METNDEYFSYGEEDEEQEEEVASPEMWGTYAYCPVIYDSDEIDILDIPMYSAIHYNVAMFYQKEIAIGMGAWIKKPMWDAQVPYFDALHELWTSKMLDYLESIRSEKKEPEESFERGMPITRNTMCTRRKPNERNEI